jgi:hypothetical protein
MKAFLRPAGLSYMFLSIWAIVWMLVVPVFHVHPETDYDHGQANHHHGGIVHTVFSPDLDGEYDHRHAHEDVGHSGPSDLELPHHPSHSLGNVEFAFTFLGSSTERKLFNLVFLHLFMVQSSASFESPPNLSVVAQHCVVTPPRIFWTCDIPSRAPPPPQFI